MPATATAQSQAAFAILSDDAALAAIGQAHSGLLTESLWTPPVLAEGERIVGWENAATAEVESSTGATAKLYASAPIRSSVGTGEPRLVDIALERAADGSYRAANPTTSYSLPSEITAGLEFEDAALGVRLAGVAPVGARDLGPKLAYPNAWTDTDLVVDPLPEGFALTQVLRSTASPESFAVDFELPAGAELVEVEIGEDFRGAAVDFANGDSVAITPPLAWDADGQTVPTDLRVTDSNSLEVSIEHRDAGFRYPLRLDPEYRYGVYGADVPWGARPWAEWGQYNPGGNRWRLFEGSHSQAPTFPQGNWGLWIDPFQLDENTGAGWYPWGETAYFFRDLPANERVYRYVSGGVAANSKGFVAIHGLFDRGSFRYVPGISSVDGQSPPMQADSTSPWTAPAEYAGWHYNYRVDHCFVGESEFNLCGSEQAGQLRPDLPGGEPIFQALIVDTTTRQPEPAAAFMRYAYIYTTPELTVPPPNAPRNTSRPTISGTPREGEVLTANKGSWTGTEPIVYDYQWERCNATVTSCSPITGAKSDRYQLTRADVDSRIRVTVKATNVAGSGGPVASDATGQVQPLTTGPEPDTIIISGPEDSTDQSSATFMFTSTLIGSSFECRFDGATWQACTSPKTYSQLLDGEHVFEVRSKTTLGAVDQTPAARRFYVDADRDEPSVQIQTGSPNADGSYQVTITALDPIGGGPSSGVEHLELMVDGDLVQEWDQQCPQGGCSMTRSATLSGSQSTTNHEIEAIADDASGNTNFATRGMPFRPYPRFGYNDEFAYPRGGTDPRFPTVLQDRLSAAWEGGARIIRFPIDWCSIAPNPTDELLPPQSWSGWGTYDPIFNAVNSFNESQPGTANDIQIIAEFLDSPGWANEDPDSGECTQAGAAPPDAAHLDDWRAFVDAALRRWGNQTLRPENGIRVVEAWNEPNLPEFWGGGSDEPFVPEYQRFAQLVNETAAALAQLKSEGVVTNDIQMLPGGTSPVRDTAANGDPRPNGAGNFWRQVLPNIPAGTINGVSFHLYAPQADTSFVLDSRRGCRQRAERIPALARDAVVAERAGLEVRPAQRSK